MTWAPVMGRVESVPLASLPAVVLDTETTGLDTDRDRVIEIGAVRFEHQPDAAHETYVTFIDPGQPIPAASIAVHGIRDADVAGAPGFFTAFTRFAEWAGPAVILGYSIGFDLAILKAECERAGLPWRSPRALDIRHLVHILAPNLPDGSLETAAGWLGIEMLGRHRALADAELTRRVFEALLPRLREKQIRTLGEAERAIRQRASLLAAETKIGWILPPESGSNEVNARAVLSRIDSFPYRHRVRGLMSAPPLVIAQGAPMVMALAKMADRKVSSLFVDGTEIGSGYGIIVERDVLRALVHHGAAALDLSAGELAVRPLVTIKQDEFVYRALALMAQREIRHLGVVDNAGRLIGALSARDLLRQRADDAVAFGSSIESAATPEELGRIWLSLPDVAGALIDEGVDAREIAAVISHELRALTERACQFAEAQLVGEGLGPAPADFGVMVLGSGGRGESLLAMDQDNAIVHADIADRPDAIAWFERFGRRLSDILDAVGVSYCKGGVMASSPQWRMDEARWRETVQHWVSRSRAQDILHCDIFFDARAVHGDVAMVEGLRRDAIDYAKGVRIFLSLLALNAGNVTSPFGILGRLKMRNGRIDLKRHCIMPIFSAARVGALRHGVTARSTLARLEALRSLDDVQPSVIDDLKESHRICFNLVLRQQLRDLAAGIRPSNDVAPTELSGHDHKEMIWALNRVPSINDILRTPMGLR
ncbi:MAG: CBS domain-containing protein [Alphaproteobacteria bacterium]|nr:CBS domain-containing protein [Alphaproteobacteria bacterium]